MNLISIYKKLKAQSSGARYVAYLKEKGVRIGKNTAILAPRHTYFDEGRAKFITIGSGCVICKNTSFIAHDYSWSVLRKSHNEIIPSGGGPIHIGSNVFIGEGATVLRNVTIGDNVIIGAGSVVTSDIPDNCVAAGNPCRKIMSMETYRDKRKAQLLQEAKSNAEYLYRRNNAVPEEKDMKNFRVLYMPRTPENMQKYLTENRCLGDDKQAFAECFCQQKPMFASYEDFIREMLRDVTDI
jgi:acetyltransferase-like isoleucine patch superfamily enzyme